MSAIHIEDIHVSVRPHFWSRTIDILQGVTLKAHQGEIVGFLGPNGAGKTTTIDAMLGLITPQCGAIEILGGTMADPNIRRRIGFMPDHSYFPMHLSGYEVVWQHGALAGLSWRDAKSYAIETLKALGLDHALHQRIGTYSKGMLQRMGVAQAIVGNPDLVVLDEPLSGLDPMGRRDIRNVMLDLKKRGTTVFFSTHILPDVELICDRVIILIDGQVRRTGTLQTLLNENGLSGVEIVVQNCSQEQASSFADLADAQAIQGNSVRFVAATFEKANVLLDRLRASHLCIQHMHAIHGSLEDVFIAETSQNESPTP